MILSCKNQPKCSQDDQGFGGDPTVVIERLATPSVANDTCRARFDLIRSQADLVSAYTELGLTDPPAVDFASKVVIARVNQEAASIVWAVSKDGGIVLGLQGCDTPSDSCSASFYTAPAPAASLDSRACDPVSCGFTPNNSNR